MNTPVKFSLYMVFICVLSFAVICQKSVVDPNTSGMEGFCGVIRGNLFNPCGNPVANATVVMRPRDYLRDLHLGKRSVENGYFIYSTRTDNRGRYSFTKADSIPEGVYCIEAWDDTNGNCIFIDNIIITSDFLNSGTWLGIHAPQIQTDNTLRPPSATRGTIQPVSDSMDVFVRVFGLNVYQKVDADGKFMLPDIPQGNYRLQFVTVGKYTSYDTVNFVTHAGEIATIDTFIPSVYRIIYDGNGNTAGMAPVDGQWYATGENLQIRGNVGNMRRTGFAFAGWNTKTDGSGTAYAAGDTLEKGTGKDVLYAQWAENRYLLTVTGNGNGKVSGSDSVAHGIPHDIMATPAAGCRFVAWRVTKGKAIVADSTKAATNVTLLNGDAEVNSEFKIRTFMKSYHGNTFDHGYCIQPTADGGFIILGDTEDSFGAMADFHIRLIKTDDAGNMTWTRQINIGFRDEGYSVQPTSDGGYVITGSTCPDDTSFKSNRIYRLKTDSKGDVEWLKHADMPDLSVCRSVLQTNDSGYIIAGENDTTGFLIKLDATGKTEWTRSFGNVQFEWALQSSDGGFVAVCSGNDYVVKTDYKGDIVWKISDEWVDPRVNIILKQTTDGGVVVVTNDYVPSNKGRIHSYIRKIDANGFSEWFKTFGIGDVYSIYQLNDGGFVTVGRIDASLTKFNSNGDSLWTTPFVGSGDTSAAGYDVRQTDDGGFIITGSYYTDFSSSDVLLIKTDENGKIETMR